MGLKYPRKIIHIDMDYFYAQIEEQKNSHLKNQPLAVGGQGTRGVIATCNYIARQFGVHSALSTRKALERCPHLVIVPERMADIYGECVIRPEQVAAFMPGLPVNVLPGVGPVMAQICYSLS
ncbi:hypothetical protein [Piscirickettsia salmonis]|uniref:Y-family DNA polymerase n=1 Tax=Piscirickettsia salmonis TaxID=1238 RepID=UPI001E3C5421|nr:hypothetical protein [Piscirickettsia salmonis]